MLQNSADTAYASQAQSVFRRLEAADSPRMSSGPEVVARKIVAAATTRNPRARYPVGKGAGTIVRARKVLPDRALDAVISRAYQH
jgi:hypothetical protein